MGKNHLAIRADSYGGDSGIVVTRDSGRRTSDLREFTRLNVPLESTDATQYLAYLDHPDGDFFILRIHEPMSKEIAEEYILEEQP